MQLKVKVTIGANEFAVEGDVAFADVVPMLEHWFFHQFAEPVDLSAVTARIAKATRELRATVEAHKG